MEWINWKYHPVPEDVRGILIKYDDGIFSDEYDYTTKKRKYREGHEILEWKFMQRSDPNRKTVHPIIRNDKSFDASKTCCEGTENLKNDEMPSQ